MTQVDFYTASSDRLRTACQLSHKAMQNGLHTVISLPDEASLDALDKLLWHYPDTAFIPHSSTDAASPVFLSYNNEQFLHHDLLINLHNTCVPFFSQFTRVIEIIGSDDQDSRAGRERYKFYRDGGHQLRHFDLSRMN